MKFYFLTFLFLTSAHAEIMTTQSLREVDLKVQQALGHYQANEILIVSDLDNTLLASNTLLGSDQWFTWQDQLLATNPAKISNLMKAQATLFAVSSMHPVEQNTAAVVQQWQSQGIPFYVLTSRPLDFRSFTERELAAQGIDPAITAPCPEHGFAKAFLPWGETKDSLDPQEQVDFDLKNERKVNYSNGIYMSAGQNKGSMIRALINKCQLHPRVIIFIDDHQRHVDRVDKALQKFAIENINFRYGAEDQRVQDFKNSSELQKQATLQWQELQDLITRLK